jgi:tRNA-splicing ligase RtcB (3'-phosphate/5'-hydroxy nucleic acid ligase)
VINFEVIQPPDDNGHKGVPVFLWNKGVKFEEAAINQLVNLSRLPFVFHHVAAMPDCHFGIGSTVGSVFATKGAVCPASVGVDIGCGMLAIKTNLKVEQLPTEIRPRLRQAIEQAVPMGRTNNGRGGDRGAWGTIPARSKYEWETRLADKFEYVCEHVPEIRKSNNLNHLGTLGTGNHFIEIQHDTEDNIWIMLHSGSRGVGNKIGTTYINKAKDAMKTWRIQIPDPDLAYLPFGTDIYDHYIYALHWAQDFALINREIMFSNVLEAFQEIVPELEDIHENQIINTHHNYASFENHYGENVLVTRKGAIRAREGDTGIIPGSMGARSYIVRGLGSQESFHSCSHGAGRAMSRNEAKRRFSVEDHARATEGVECDKTADTIDETPAAYKSIDAVIEAERDLVTPIVTLKQLICCKGIS